MKAEASEQKEERLDALTTAVTNSPKYANISPDFVRRVGRRELAARRSLKEAVKATKSKLHQVGGAYFAAGLNYGRMLARLRQTADSPTAFRQTCRDLMRRHASTRERLPILDEFYRLTLADLPDIRVIIDLACGLNPLARLWMPFDSAAQYFAYDIYADLISFVGEFMKIGRINGRARVGDIIGHPPVETADLILLLKTLPVLEQVEKGAASRLLDALNTRYLLITFPARSLGGRNKGMVQNYEAQFHAWTKGRGWQIRRFEFPGELAFLVTV